MPGARRIRAETDGGSLKGGAPRVVWLTLGTAPRAVSIQSAAQRLVSERRPCHLVWDPMTGEIVQLISILRAGRALGAPEQLDWGPDRVPAAPEKVNSQGRLCVQIGVLGHPADPFTSGPLAGISAIVNWLDSWNVPRCWPAGQPAGYRAGGLNGAVGGGLNGAVGGGLNGAVGGGLNGALNGGLGGGLNGGLSGALGGGLSGGLGTCLDRSRGRAGVDRSRMLWSRGGHFGASQVPDCDNAGPGAIDVDRLTGAHVLQVHARELPTPLPAALPMPIPA
jgi:hypothetical protein